MARFGFFLSWGIAKNIAKPFRFIGDFFSPFFPELARDLEILGADATASEYIIMSFLNALLYSLLLFILLLSLLYARFLTLLPFDSLIPSLAALFLLFFFFLYHPKILVGKMMENIDRDLIFALKDLSLQISSGLNLFDALHNVSRSGYGLVSKEFAIVVKDISAGEPEESALAKMIQRTESEYMKKTIWQLVAVLRSGASLQTALTSIVEGLKQNQNEKIASYIQEMNLWVLLFLVVAIVIPSLSAVLIVVLSSLAGFGIREGAFLLLIAGCLLAQFILIKYIKVRRPAVHM